jgi:hypothetical protein
MNTKTLLIGMIALPLALAACNDDAPADSGTETETSATGDGDGDGDGDPGDGDGDTTGDGDGDGDTTGDGDGDGDGDPPDPIVYPDNAPEDYTRVDRKGMPAVATAVITSKDDYNAADPVDDAMLTFVPEITASVQGLHMALDDDLLGLGAVPCAAIDCLAQGGPLVIPDTLKLDLAAPAGFPNGRALPNQVIDITLAVLMLDLSVMGQTATLFADLPLNPPENDADFMTEFPYLAPPN